MGPSCSLRAILRAAACTLALALAAAAPRPAHAQFDLGEAEPKVQRVEIDGNRAYEDKVLKSILRTRGKSFFHPWRDTPLRSDFLRYDRQVIEDFYRRRGYLDARVDTVEVVHGQGKDVVVRFAIVEGAHAKVAAVELDGPDAAEEQALRRLIPLHAGAYFDYPKVETGHAMIDSFYAESGHVAASTRDSIAITDQGVLVHFDVHPGPATVMRSIVIQGTQATKPLFVSREVVLKPGALLARSKLLRSQQRIYDSGLYNDVQFSTSAIDSATQSTDLIVTVRERRLGWIDAGVGVAYSPSLSLSSGQTSLDIFRVTGQVGQRNLFRDAVRLVTTARFGVRARTKPQLPYIEDLFGGDRRADVSLTRDWLAGLRLQGTIGAFAEEVPKSVGQVYPYRAIGASAGLRRDLDLWTRAAVVYRPTRVFSDTVSAKTPSGKDIRSYSSNRVALTLDHDTRLDLFDPRAGKVANATAEFAGGAFKGTAQFLKLSGSAAGYRPRGRRMTLAIRGRAGVIRSRGQGVDVGLEDSLSRLDLIPLTDRFFLGGASSVRGYHDNEIGQVFRGDSTAVVKDNGAGGVDTVGYVPAFETRGGSFLLLVNAELRMRLAGFVGAALFFDAGNVWEHVEDVTWRRIFSFSNGAGYNDMKYAAGVGVRIATPVGPVRLDYGWKLRLPRGDQPNSVTGRGAFAFSLGQAF